MSQNQYTVINVHLTQDPKVKTIKAKGGKERQVVELRFAENPWNEKRFLTKWVTATFPVESRDGKLAAGLKKGAVISTGGRQDVRTYEVGEGRKKEMRIEFEIQYPTFLEVQRVKAAPADEEAVEADGAATSPELDGEDGDGEGGGEKDPWEE